MIDYPLLPRKERVRRGARWLDQINPGWSASVKTYGLDVEDRWRCVLGQLYSWPDERSPRYGSGYRRVVFGEHRDVPDLDADMSIEFGFAEPWSDENYRLLTRYWREEIAQRERGARR